jgi:hypothetical protein
MEWFVKTVGMEKGGLIRVVLAIITAGFQSMRQSDFDFARDLLTQAGLRPEELTSTPQRGLMVTLESNRLVTWFFDWDGNFLQFESDGLIPVG